MQQKTTWMLCAFLVYFSQKGSSQHTEFETDSSYSNVIAQFSEEEIVWISETDISLPSRNTLLNQYQWKNGIGKFATRFQLNTQTTKWGFRAEQSFNQWKWSGFVHKRQEKGSWTIGNLRMENQPLGLGNTRISYRPFSALQYLSSPLSLKGSFSLFAPSQFWGVQKQIKLSGGKRLTLAGGNTPTNNNWIGFGSFFHPFAWGFIQVESGWNQGSWFSSNSMYYQDRTGNHQLGLNITPRGLTEVLYSYIYPLDRWADLTFRMYRNIVDLKINPWMDGGNQQLQSAEYFGIYFYPKRRISLNLLYFEERKPEKTTKEYRLRIFRSGRSQKSSIAFILRENIIQKVRAQHQIFLFHGKLNWKIAAYHRSGIWDKWGLFHQASIKLTRNWSLDIGQGFNPEDNGSFYHYQNGLEYQWNFKMLGSNNSLKYLLIGYKKERLKNQFKVIQSFQNSSLKMQYQIQCIYSL
ncbi:MAG: hypothetical protein ACJAY8_001326 [Sphingobacteriales bacterium]|jgi:hypothetical protein